MEDTLKYFNGDELATNVFLNKYAANEKETPDQMHIRLSKEFSYIEEQYREKETTTVKNYLSNYGKERSPLDTNKIYNYFKNFKYIIPGGSILTTLGTNKISSLSNCFFNGEMTDNINSIWNTTKSMAQIGKMRGGTSTDISLLRPRGAKINNSANVSSGAVEWMNLIDITGKLIGQEGRKMAIMITMDINHPDIEEFITIKNDLSKITNANISIKLNKDFMKAVENNEDYILRYPCNLIIPDSYYEVDNPTFLSEYNRLYKLTNVDGNNYIKKIKAKELWDKIINSAWKYAEPGLLYWDTVIDYDPSSVYKELKPRGTNPCCFSKDSNVYVITHNGVKEIKNINNSDLIWLEKENKFVPCSGYFNSGNAEVFAVEFTNGEVLEITSNHKLAKIKPKRTGTRISNTNFELIELQNLKIGDKIKIQNSQTNAFGTLGTKEEGLILGWLTGDGFLSYKGMDDIYPTMFLDFWKTEYDLVKPFQQIINSFGINVQIQKRKNYENEILRLASSDLTKYYTHKYQTNIWKFKEGFNQFLYNASKEFIIGYLSSYFSADGTVSTNNENKSYSIELSSINKDRLLQVKNLLTNFGIKSSIYISKKESNRNIRGIIYNCKQIYKLSITGLNNIKLFCSEIGFSCKYKQDKLINLCNVKQQKESKGSEYTTIKSILSLGSKSVGCINVPNYNYFTANGIISGNSELPLSTLDSCRLISVNLYSLVNNPFTDKAEIDYKKAYEIFYETQVLCDDLVDLEAKAIDKILNKINPNWEKDLQFYEEGDSWIDGENFTIFQSEEFQLWWKIKEIGLKGRRTGCGITAYADMLAALNKPYGDKNITEKLFKLKLEAELDASIDMSIIRGSFPLWNANLEFTDINEYDNDCITLEGTNNWYKFILKEFPDHVRRMYSVGRRNVGISTVPPAGSLSILAQTSSGIEPLFQPYYIRRKKCNSNEKPDFIDNNGVAFKEFVVVHPKLKEWYCIKGYEHFYINSANDVVLLENLKLSDWEELYKKSPWYKQIANDINWETRIETQSLIQKYITASISSTINLSKDTTKELVDKIYRKAYNSKCKGLTVYVDGSRSGVLVNSSSVTQFQQKRPERIECKLIRFYNNSEPWIAFVGLLDNKPYEIFTGKSDNDTFPIPKNINTGFIIKIKENSIKRYDFEYIDSYGYINRLGGLSRIFSEEYWNYAKLISALLRGNTEIHKVLKIIDGLYLPSDTLNTWKQGIKRALKEFVEDGEISHEICPNCKTKKVYEGGCSICKSCGDTKCE